jgi:hypothetical protein
MMMTGVLLQKISFSRPNDKNSRTTRCFDSAMYDYYTGTLGQSCHASLCYGRWIEIIPKNQAVHPIGLGIYDCWCPVEGTNELSLKIIMHHEKPKKSHLLKFSCKQTNRPRFFAEYRKHTQRQLGSLHTMISTSTILLAQKDALPVNSSPSGCTCMASAIS